MSNPPPPDGTATYQPPAGPSEDAGPLVTASVLADLRRSVPRLQPVLLREPAGEESGGVERPLPPGTPPPVRTGHYHLFGEIARGGPNSIRG